MNAKTDLLKIFKSNKQTIKCAYIGLGDDPSLIEIWENKECDNELLILPVGYTKAQLKTFLLKIDIDYDDFQCENEYKEVFGTVWAEDPSFWATRRDFEMCCGMYWTFPQKPFIPKCVKLK